jgi:hypothetical protein
MKKFNKVIQVEVSLDTIAQNLLSTMNEAFPHRELVVENIIGSSDAHQLSLLYNSLNGYTNEIDFNVGDIIKPTNVTSYGYWTEEDVNAGSTSCKAIEEAEIIEINIYAPEKLRIKYVTPRKDGTMNVNKTWIRHTECELSIARTQEEVIDAIMDKI